MGIGPPIIELYRQLKLQGAFQGVTNVMELGSQDYWCPQQNLIRGLFSAFGRDPEPTLLEVPNSNQKPAALLYTALGIKYCCVDVDDRPGSVMLDLNFDAVPNEHKSRYGLVTNHGTSEHIINQYNIFKSMHDFARTGGLLIHSVPFTVHLEHGFFNYQPNFFEALARYNSYETLGIWVGVDWRLASLIPWERTLLDYLTFSAQTTHSLVVVQRKRFSKEFCAPFQKVYEEMVPEQVRSRYNVVVNGEILDSTQHLNEIAALKNTIENLKRSRGLSAVSGRELVIELARRVKRRLRTNN